MDSEPENVCVSIEKRHTRKDKREIRNKKRSEARGMRYAAYNDKRETRNEQPAICTLIAIHITACVTE